MPVRFYCSGCQARIKVPDQAAGKRVKCPRCGLLQRSPRESAVDRPEDAEAPVRQEAPPAPAQQAIADDDPLAALAAAAAGGYDAGDEEAAEGPAFTLDEDEPAEEPPPPPPPPPPAPKPRPSPKPVVRQPEPPTKPAAPPPPKEEPEPQPEPAATVSPASQPEPEPETEPQARDGEPFVKEPEPAGEQLSFAPPSDGPTAPEDDPLAALAAAAGQDSSDVAGEENRELDNATEPVFDDEGDTGESGDDAKPDASGAANEALAAAAAAAAMAKPAVAPRPTPKPIPLGGAASNESSNSAAAQATSSGVGSAVRAGGPKAIPLSAHPSAYRPAAKAVPLDDQPAGSTFRPQVQLKPPPYTMLVVLTWALRVLSAAALVGAVRLMLEKKEQAGARPVDMVIALIMGLAIAAIALGVAEGLRVLRDVARATYRGKL